MSEETIAQETLVSLGLSLGEAKTYLALVTLGPSEATPLSDDAGVPQSKIYQYLSNLETKFGVVKKTEIDGKPNQYRAEHLETVIEKLKGKLEDHLEITKKYVHSKQVENESQISDSDFIWVSQGQRAITNNLQELISKSQAENFLVLGVESVVQNIKKYFDTSDAKFLTLGTLLDPMPPIVKILSMTEIPKILEELQVMVIMEDVDFVNKTSKSFNIIGYPTKEMEIDPLMVQIKHPVIRNFQIKLFLTLIQTLKSMDPSKMMQFMDKVRE